MRKVFVFWGVILFFLVAGAIAIIYGKILLKEEKEKGRIMRIHLPSGP